MKRLTEIYAYDSESKTSIAWPSLNLDDAAIDMFTWINEDEEVEIIYSTTGNNRLQQITHRSMKNYAKSSPITYGANSQGCTQEHILKLKF
jgi:hypothetical protein